MFRNTLRYITSVSSSDDNQIYVIRKDLSSGINSRQHGSLIGDTQATVLYNVDIGTQGQASKRYGSVLVGSLASLGSNVVGLYGFDIQGATDQLVSYTNDTIYRWLGASNWTAMSYGSLMSGSTYVGMVQAKESGLSPDDILVFYNGRNNVIRMDTDGALQDLGDTNTSPPLTDVMCWYGNRLWGLKNDLLYFSDAYDEDYSGAFDRSTNNFRIPVGQERGLIPTRDTGIIVMGSDAIWGLAPSVVPVATDKPEPLVTNRGVVSKRGWVNAGDDIYYFAQDGFRALKRTVQDKLQAGTDYPISYYLKDEFDSIAWAYIDRLSMEYFDNKIFIAVPTSASTFDTWVYYPQTKGFMVVQGWSPNCWAKYKVSGEEFLYYGSYGKNKVYQAWTGFTDEGTTTTDGTAITYQEEGRKEDCGQPLLKKSGGVLKIKAVSSGDYDISVYVSADDQAYVTMGVINLTGNQPTLPVTLPFTLASNNVVTAEFSLDSLGEWNQLRIKLVHNAVNGSDEITVLERDIITYALTLQDEA